jgi:tetratricopeptide (TPR) repeat protein
MPRTCALLALPLIVLSCALVPDDEPEKRETPKGPQFDADYYALNAKEYMDGGQFGRAKTQWEQFLKLRPNDWMARLGTAFADLFLAEEAVVRRGDFKLARAQVASSEAAFAELQRGPLEDDTLTQTPEPNWKPAYGAALASRYLGFFDQIESRREAEAAAKGGPDAAERKAASARLAESRDRRYAEAIVRFERLAAMKNESPEAVRNLAQLYLVTRQDAKAEGMYLRYLAFARATRADIAERKEKTVDEYEIDRRAVVASLYDQKLSSNAAKQIGVLDDLAGLAFARGDFRESKKFIEEALTLDSDRKDLYLKLAQSEGELQMYETAVLHLDEFLARSSRKREDFDEAIYRALRMRKDFESRLARR